MIPQIIYRSLWLKNSICKISLISIIEMSLEIMSVDLHDIALHKLLRQGPAQHVHFYMRYLI